MTTIKLHNKAKVETPKRAKVKLGSEVGSDRQRQELEDQVGTGSCSFVAKSNRLSNETAVPCLKWAEAFTSMFKLGRSVMMIDETCAHPLVY